MADTEQTQQVALVVRRAIEVSIRLVLVFLLVWWGFNILRPFIDLLAWSGIIAVALYPVCLFLSAKTGLGEKKAVWIVCLLLIALLIVPSVQLIMSSVETGKEVATELQEGTLRVPAPTDKVKGLPLIGDRIYDAWLLASQNLEATAQKFSDQLKTAGSMALGAITGIGLNILKFTFAIIIAGVFMANTESVYAFTLKLSRRIVGGEGAHFVELAIKTVRSVAQGVLGIAVIQAAAAGIGLAIMDIPLAPLWVLAVLMLAIVQLPPLLILVPIAAFSFSTHETASATIFTVYCLVVSMSDSFLKPLLLGRGVEVPMLVILLGAIGGMIASGIIGLFVGAVVLALVYQLFMEWLDRQTPGTEEAPEAQSQP